MRQLYVILIMLSIAAACHRIGEYLIPQGGSVQAFLAGLLVVLVTLVSVGIIYIVAEVILSIIDYIKEHL